jgi:carbon-monoxide dehydrogenase medium subunit
MTIAHDFEYVRACTLEEATAVLAEPGARVLAGGTDVVPWLRDGLIEPAVLVDIKAIPALAQITLEGGRLHIGALVTFSDLIESAVVRRGAPVLWEMAARVASVGVRNRATVVGNLCSAVPSLDAGPALMAFDTELHAAGTYGERCIPIAEWFVGPRATALGAGEVVTGATLTLPEGGHGGAFLKLARYAGEDLAQANLAVTVTRERHYRVAFGAVAPKPVRARPVESLLSGRDLDDDLLDAAVGLVPDCIAPITDIRATAAYRTHMCRVMLRRGLAAAVQRLSDAGPPYPTRLI